MTTPVWVELVCADCAKADIGQWVFNGQVPIRKLRQTARSQGWLFKHKEVFCSDDCLAAYEGATE
jgi:hypothetical protein